MPRLIACSRGAPLPLGACSLLWIAPAKQTTEHLRAVLSPLRRPDWVTETR